LTSLIDLRTAILAKNDGLAQALRDDLNAAGTVTLNLLSSPGAGKTELLELVLADFTRRGIPVAALTGDLATENDARRLARSGAPARQVVTSGLCHLEADLVRDHLVNWLPVGTRLLFIENVGNLVCPASYDIGENLRVVLASVTEGEDKPVKYPTAYRWADLVILTKTDIAEAVGFDRSAFDRSLLEVGCRAEVIATSGRTGAGLDQLIGRLGALIAAADNQTDPNRSPIPRLATATSSGTATSGTTASEAPASAPAPAPDHIPANEPAPAS
jgi:hydrogenase nickel incorporation protein HypB